MSKPSKASKSPQPTQTDIARIQGAVAKKNNGKVPKGSYVGRIQKVVSRQPRTSTDK